jgi:hypothetical protein
MCVRKLVVSLPQSLHIIRFYESHYVEAGTKPKVNKAYQRFEADALCVSWCNIFESHDAPM